MLIVHDIVLEGSKANAKRVEKYVHLTSTLWLQVKRGKIIS